MSSAWFNGPPGVGAVTQAIPKALFLQKSEQFLAQGRYIDPTNSRDPANTANVGVLEPGLIMGMITSSGLYAPSIFGLTNGALSASGTSVTLPSAAVGTEIVRRIGNTGNVNLIGPPTAGGTVQTLQVAYSAISGTTMTITSASVNAVQTLSFTNSPSGTFQLGFQLYTGGIMWTAPITYSGTAATLVSNINTALGTAFGSSQIVASGSAVTAIALTFSGSNYSASPQPLGLIDVGGLSAGNVSIVNTTAGVNGAFVTKSIIAPTDGSQNPLSFLPDWNAGIKVITDSGVSITGNVDFPLLPVAGLVDVGQMVNWPADTSLIAWLEGKLSNAFGGKFAFGGVGGVY